MMEVKERIKYTFPVLLMMARKDQLFPLSFSRDLGLFRDALVGSLFYAHPLLTLCGPVFQRAFSVFGFLLSSARYIRDGSLRSLVAKSRGKPLLSFFSTKKFLAHFIPLSIPTIHFLSSIRWVWYEVYCHLPATYTSSERLHDEYTIQSAAL